jgi:hypothetical protein
MTTAANLDLYRTYVNTASAADDPRRELAVGAEARANIYDAEAVVAVAARAVMVARVRLMAARWQLAVTRRQLAEEVMFDPTRTGDDGCSDSGPCCGGYFMDCNSVECRNVAWAEADEADALNDLAEVVDAVVPPVWWDGIPPFQWTYQWKGIVG